MSFPLFLWLQRVFPGHEVWVMAFKHFYEQLQALSPAVKYIDAALWQSCKKENFELVLNLSFDRQAAWICSELTAERRLGPIGDKKELYVRGAWQLYRTSLVHNNRHNKFHWAELNALDCIPLPIIAKTSWSPPRRPEIKKKRIGLFIGASQKEKRPDAAFWAELAGNLLQKGFYPVFLGGKAEKRLAQKIRSQLKENIPDFCGQLTLAQFADLGQRLSLLVTPDTGPMHLAAWTGLFVFNLSLGPVNPWETGPYQPGHFVLSSNISCRGCWECTHSQILCRRAFTPQKIAAYVAQIMKNRQASLNKLRPRGLSLLQSSRFTSGLYELFPFQGRLAASNSLCSDFWYSFWGSVLGLWAETEPAKSGLTLKNEAPHLKQAMLRSLIKLTRQLTLCSFDSSPLFRQELWLNNPASIRSLCGYLQTYLQNENFSSSSRLKSVKLVEQAISFLS